jgi:NAD(P)H-hydrate epimerase
MSEISRRVYRPQDVRELDRIAIEEQGIPGYELMCRAGQAAFKAITQRCPHARRWLVLCGSGNNAGDGYVIARLARAQGIEVQLIALSSPEGLSGDAAQAWRDFAAESGHAEPWDGCDIATAVAAADVIVDALLGTGLMRPLEGAYLQAVTAVELRAKSTALIAVDITTGLSGLTGEVMGAAAHADLTVTFVGLKQGLFLGSGPDYSGEVVFDDLGAEAVPPERVQPTMRVFAEENFRALLPRRERTGHKGNYGHVLVIGGNLGMAGAARLAGEAALRTGAGLVSIATRAANVGAIVEGRPELMCHGVETGAELDELLGRAAVIALGPGLGQDEWSVHMFERALATRLPMVIDADALNLLAQTPGQRDNWILTPHPGEAGRLLQTNAAEVQADRLGSLQKLLDTYGGCALLKGHGTLVGMRDSTPWLIRGGNPGMATAGMGDVLTGITAAMCAQCLTSEASLDRIAAAAAWLHATAGDRAAIKGERGLIAGDLFAELRACVNS